MYLIAALCAVHLYAHDKKRVALAFAIAGVIAFLGGA